MNIKKKGGNEMEHVTVRRVENLSNNQVIIHLTNGKDIFNSYGKNIVEIDRKEQTVKIDVDFWDYSQTTSKYRCQFLGEKKPETEKKIKSGEYILTELNFN